MRKHRIILLLNIIIPLIFGLVIYLLLKPNTYISELIYSLFNIRFDYYISNKGIIRIFIYNYLCDILWAYALTFTVYYFVNSFTHKYLLTLFITNMFCVLIELLQYFGIVSGTFDIFDILLECVSSALALMYILFLFHGGKENENH